jgi:hypothetical protein
MVEVDRHAGTDARYLLWTRQSHEQSIDVSAKAPMILRKLLGQYSLVT